MQPLNETSSDTLMARFRERLDAEAIEQLVARFIAPGAAVAGQMLADPALAEDAVQEAFLRVVRSRTQYQPGRPFSSWFYAILRNVCHDMLRRRSRHAQAIHDIACRTFPPAEPPPDLDGDAPSLLDRLPADARAVLELRIVHEMPFRDVAAALDISEEAARKRAQRALRRLREVSGFASAQPDPSPARAAPVSEKPAEKRVPDPAS